MPDIDDTCNWPGTDNKHFAMLGVNQYYTQPDYFFPCRADSSGAGRKRYSALLRTRHVLTLVPPACLVSEPECNK